MMETICPFVYFFFQEVADVCLYIDCIMMSALYSLLHCPRDKDGLMYDRERDVSNSRFPVESVRIFKPFHVVDYRKWKKYTRSEKGPEPPKDDGPLEGGAPMSFFFFGERLGSELFRLHENVSPV